ncbi:MAG: hypothetical protein ABI151_05635 [Chitinophagaceae bacterium]
MKDEIFDLAFTHADKQYMVRVKTDLPLGPEPFGADYDIYLGRKLWYVLNHCNNEDEVACWEIKKAPKEGAEPGVADAIGKAIDRHFG